MHSSSAPPERARLEALTGLRFLAAFHVVLFHAALWERWSGPAAVRHVVSAGYVAVGLFFMLSGFVLTYTHGGPAPVSRTSFYAARFARIYPVYALSLLLALPFALRTHLEHGGVGPFLAEGLAAFSLVQSWHPSFAMAWNPPGWSLSVEAFFYASFPFLAPRLVVLSPRRTLAVMAGALAVLLALPLAWALSGPEGWSTRYDTEGLWLDVLRYHPLVRLPEFILGICLGRLFAHAPLRAALARHAGLLATSATALLLGVLALGPRVPYVLLHNGLLVPAFAVLLLALATDQGLPARLLRHPWLVRLGEASYSLYILHTPVVMLVRSVGSRLLGREVLDTPAFVAGTLALTVVASLVSYRLVEQPLHRRLRRAFAATPKAPPGVAGAPAAPATERA
ncbi:acyltransferase [Archangium sp.]|jgi:peptidoglycan/LPS O-acetylase OafA/YrhL|uniref:acyltransferase family protein n=1 Tax=Archangium sp. TaxID=1872627 RepID=UPI002ED83902